MSDMTRQTIRLQEGDDIVLKYIGAAVVLQWQHLAADVQQAIRQQAECIGGLPPAAELRQQITSLIERDRRHA